MSIKLINEAMRRVNIPAGNAEHFKAGVRALALAAQEVIKEDQTRVNETSPQGHAELAAPYPYAIQHQLSDLICKVFDNEAAFLKHFKLGGDRELEEFYMAGERCRVVYLGEWGHITTTIKTADFLADPEIRPHNYYYSQY